MGMDEFGESRPPILRCSAAASIKQRVYGTAHLRRDGERVADADLVTQHREMVAKPKHPDRSDLTATTPGLPDHLLIR